MTKTDGNSKRNKQRWSRVFENIRRAKSWCDNALDDTLHFHFTHEQELAEFSKLRKAEWYKKLPRWARNEVQGYEDAIRRSKYSPLYKALKSGHLYNNKLYVSYDHWRRNFPSLQGSELSDTCVSYWPVEQGDVNGGKIHFAGLTDGQKELQGKWFPIAD